jgi:hypothetical protein
VTSEERLAALYDELRRLGLRCLVVGGHAVRFYGVDRSTLDFDFHIALAAEQWAQLPTILGRSPLLAKLREGPSWRPADFRRFVIGLLPDGREERIECWRHNHLLAPFDELLARSVQGPYGGRRVACLGIDDLIRSKETEREDDWRDIRLLEEIADERRMADAEDRPVLLQVLAHLRSQRGFERALESGLFADPDLVAEAWRVATTPMTLGYLGPWAPPGAPVRAESEGIRAILEGPARKVAPGSARHRALVEAVRRLYIRMRMAEDRADKERAASG